MQFQRAWSSHSYPASSPVPSSSPCSQTSGWPDPRLSRVAAATWQHRHSPKCMVYGLNPIEVSISTFIYIYITPLMVYDINPMIYNQLGLISMAITVYRLSHFISWNQKIMMYSFHSGFRKNQTNPVLDVAAYPLSSVGISVS